MTGRKVSFTKKHRIWKGEKEEKKSIGIIIIFLSIGISDLPTYLGTNALGRGKRECCTLLCKALYSAFCWCYIIPGQKSNV